MSRPEIINITRYASTDIWACVQGLMPAVERILTVKICYRMKPFDKTKAKSHGFVRQKSVRKRAVPAIDLTNWADASRPYENQTHLNIALLHPDKLPMPPLQALAQAADGEPEFAHQRIVDDLIDALAEVFRTPALATMRHETGMTIRLNASVDPAQRKLAAFKTFEAKVKSGRGTIERRKRSLAGAIFRRDDAQQHINKLCKKIPVLEERQRKLEEELSSRATKMSDDR